MKDTVLPYLEFHKNRVKNLITDSLSSKNRGKLFHTIKKRFKEAKSFHAYYSKTISNKENFLSDQSFFRQFKQQYSLQGIDRAYLKRLEENKTEILSLIENDDLVTLYFKFFYNVKIKHGDTTVLRNLSSFFAKLAHTLAPNKYCALDNPIKQYFRLEKESFYIAFIVINKAYQEWAEENPIDMEEIKSGIESFVKTNMTNLKILDFIFWYIANPK